MNVKVRVGGGEVLVKKKNVGVDRADSVAVGERVPVDERELPASVEVGVNVGAETISENATTVSTITVLMLETRKSTTPTTGVPV